MNIAPRNGPSRVNLLRKQRQIIGCANSVAKRAYNMGITCSFHPSSPPTSYFRVEEDYTLLFEELDTRYVSYTPDADHIAFGNMDVREIYKRYMSIIKHVHFKDASVKNEWMKMGSGDIDFPEIVKELKSQGFKGWIMLEEKTTESTQYPDQVVLNISSYVEKN